VALKEIVALPIKFATFPDQIWRGMPQQKQERAHDLDLVLQDAFRLVVHSHPR